MKGEKNSSVYWSASYWDSTLDPGTTLLRWSSSTNGIHSSLEKNGAENKRQWKAHPSQSSV